MKLLMYSMTVFALAAVVAKAEKPALNHVHKRVKHVVKQPLKVEKIEKIDNQQSSEKK